jgi:hypothetical protein
LLNAFAGLLRAYQTVVNGNEGAAVRELNAANEYAVAANDLLEQLQVQTTITDCGAEIWYAGLADDINAYLALIDGVTATTPPSNEIRSAVFDVQELRRTSEAIYPDCATQANNHLLLGMEAAVTMFQAIMSEDAVTAQAHLTTVVNERTAFMREMQTLGVPLIRDTAQS